MDLKWIKECSKSLMKEFPAPLPISVTSKVNKPPEYHLLDDILSSYFRSDDEEIERFYVGCEDGFFRVSLPKNETDVVKWMCIAKAEDEFHKEVLRRVLKQESLVALGLGRCEDLSESTKRKIYESFRPKTLTNGIQVQSNMSDSDSQTDWTGLRSHNIACQAKPETADCGVQAKPPTVESGTCTSPWRDSKAPTSLHCQNNPKITIQAIISQSRLTGHIDEPFSVKVNGITRTMDKDTSKRFMEVVKYLIDRIPHLKSAIANQNITLEFKDMFPAAMFDSPPNCAGGDLRNVDPNDDKVPEKNHELLQNMSAGEGVVRYHAELPFYKHNERYLSATSPFSKYGYHTFGELPETLSYIRIPVVSNKDVTLQKNGNGCVVLGNGSFGCVYLAKHEMLPFDVCVKEFEMDSSTIYDVYHEAKLLIYLQTTKFVPFCLGLMESPFLPSDLSLVQECFANGCTLRMLLKDKPLVVVKRKWIAICYQLFWGLNIFHEKQVLLNDIKSDNILVDYNSSDIMGNIRFIDLGLASYRRGYRFCNDRAFLEQFANYAPEVRRGCHSTPASDLYAVGYLVRRISETFLIPEVHPIALECTVEDPGKRPPCYSVLDKLEDMVETM
ncbi:uncharacterized protein [Argopecten irradians]|uniref:uncharacterized protein n=1 Tax=Argopecten irradians TaxID=31199 RepID=UPI0037170C47